MRSFPSGDTHAMINTAESHILYLYITVKRVVLVGDTL